MWSDLLTIYTFIFELLSSKQAELPVSHWHIHDESEEQEECIVNLNVLTLFKVI